LILSASYDGTAVVWASRRSTIAVSIVKDRAFNKACGCSPLTYVWLYANCRRPTSSNVDRISQSRQHARQSCLIRPRRNGVRMDGPTTPGVIRRKRGTMTPMVGEDLEMLQTSGRWDVISVFSCIDRDEMGDIHDHRMQGMICSPVEAIVVASSPRGR
jgi:hypothetical protein